MYYLMGFGLILLKSLGYTFGIALFMYIMSVIIDSFGKESNIENTLKKNEKTLLITAFIISFAYVVIK
jgi:hypothetical protein